MTAADPGRVLRRALLGWGLGHVMLGRRRTGMVLLVAELLSLATVALLTFLLADTTAYLVPFLAGVAVIAAWTLQAVWAYRIARRATGPGADVPARSPAGAIAWLCVPLLVWASGFWLLGAQAATPAAVLNRFVVDWAHGRLAGDPWPAGTEQAARAASRALDELCERQRLDPNCGGDAGRLRDLRVRIVDEGDRRATALAEAIRFERRASSFLGFPTAEVAPVAVDRLLTIRLSALPAALGAQRWRIVDVEAAG